MGRPRTIHCKHFQFLQCLQHTVLSQYTYRLRYWDNNYLVCSIHFHIYSVHKSYKYHFSSRLCTWGMYQVNPTIIMVLRQVLAMVDMREKGGVTHRGEG